MTRTDHPSPPPPRLRGQAAIARHLALPGKPARYRDLLARFGVDPDACAALGTVERPRVLLAEQAGCWLTLRDQARLAFGRALVAALGLPDADCLLRSLGADCLAHGGEKAQFLELDVHPAFGSVRLIGARTMRRRRRLSYRTLPLDAATRARIETIFGALIEMGEAIARGPEAFAAAMRAAFRAGAQPGFRSLLPIASDHRNLRALGDEFAAHHIGPLIDFFRFAKARTAEADRWAPMWDEINGRFLGRPVGTLDPLFDQLTLTITDPAQAGRALAEVGGHDPEVGVPLVGILAADDTYRTVQWSANGMWWQSSAGRHTIEWDEVRALAAAGRSGGPTGVLEYLMLAATGHYLVIDCRDEVTPFQAQACAVHAQLMGCGFPWVTFVMRPNPGPEADADGFSLLDAADPRATERIAQAVRWSLAE